MNQISRILLLNAKVDFLFHLQWRSLGKLSIIFGQKGGSRGGEPFKHPLRYTTVDLSYKIQNIVRKIDIKKIFYYSTDSNKIYIASVTNSLIK